MFFEAAAQYTHLQVDPSPVAAGAKDVPDASLFRLKSRQPSVDVQGKRLLLTLDAGAGETVTLSLWALDEATFNQQDAAPNLAARKFYLVQTALVVTANQITEVTAKCPPGGIIYGQLTADTLVAAGVVKATCVG